MSSGNDFFATPRPATTPPPVAQPATPALAPAQPAAPPPAWYADPQVPGQLRWYDGARWTEHTAPAAPPGYAPPGYAPAGYAPGGWGAPAQRDRAMEALLPVNRSGLAIAAGYAGLFSILLIFGPVAILLGVLALRDLAGKPTVGGRGRAWFGIIAGSIGTLVLVLLVVR